MFRVEDRPCSTADVFNNELPVARLYKIETGVKVHMFTDDYEFETGSIDEALPLIKIRWERPKEWN